MKKVKLDKLSLNKWVVASLQPDALKTIKGGYGTANGATCGTASDDWGSSCKCPTRTQRAGCITSGSNC